MWSSSVNTKCCCQSPLTWFEILMQPRCQYLRVWKLVSARCPGSDLHMWLLSTWPSERVIGPRHPRCRRPHATDQSHGPVANRGQIFAEITGSQVYCRKDNMLNLLWEAVVDCWALGAQSTEAPYRNMGRRKMVKQDQSLWKRARERVNVSTHVSCYYSGNFHFH